MYATMYPFIAKEKKLDVTFKNIVYCTFHCSVLIYSKYEIFIPFCGDVFLWYDDFVL